MRLFDAEGEDDLVRVRIVAHAVVATSHDAGRLGLAAVRVLVEQRDQLFFRVNVVKRLRVSEW